MPAVSVFGVEIMKFGMMYALITARDATIWQELIQEQIECQELKRYQKKFYV